MIEQLLELRRCQSPFAHLEVRQPADVSWIETVEGVGIREIVFNRGPQDFDGRSRLDRKSTRLNSSHSSISYAVFCLKKKKKKKKQKRMTKKKKKNNKIK